MVWIVGCSIAKLTPRGYYNGDIQNIIPCKALGHDYLVDPMDNLTCEKCNGSGNQCWTEDDREVLDMCYACAGSGKVDEDALHSQRMQKVIAIIAQNIILGLREACNEDPCGEGWDFAAAENMMTEWDYTKTRIYEKEGDIERQVSCLEPETQRALLRLLLPQKPKKKAEVIANPTPPAPPASIDSDDIPF